MRFVRHIDCPADVPPKTSPVVVTVMTAHNAVLISPTKRPRGVLYGLPAPSACLASASPSQFLFFDAASCVLFSARVTKAQFCNQALAAPAPSRRSRRAHRALRFRCVRTVGRCAVERGHSGGAARVVARQSSQPRVIQLILRLSVLKVLWVFHTLPFLGGDARIPSEAWNALRVFDRTIGFDSNQKDFRLR